MKDEIKPILKQRQSRKHGDKTMKKIRNNQQQINNKSGLYRPVDKPALRITIV